MLLIGANVGLVTEESTVDELCMAANLACEA